MANTTKKTANLELWNSVCKTDPAHTKKVQLGRTFTAIDPHYQIKRATEMFGPAGEGWGWSVANWTIIDATKQVAVLVQLWHGNANGYIEQWGQTGLFIDAAEKKKDTDSFKKATTDGLTKCLSYLGFNADVFEGKFDDNKYVEAMAEEHSDKPKWKGPLGKAALGKALKELVTDINASDDADTLNGVVTVGIDLINQCADDMPTWYEGEGDIKGLQATIADKTEELNAKEIDVRM